MAEQYGSKILSARSVKRLSQQKVAAMYGITTATLVDIEYDRIEISENTCLGILAAIERLDAEAEQAAA